MNRLVPIVVRCLAMLRNFNYLMRRATWRLSVSKFNQSFFFLHPFSWTLRDDVAKCAELMEREKSFQKFYGDNSFRKRDDSFKQKATWRFELGNKKQPSLIMMTCLPWNSACYFFVTLKLNFYHHWYLNNSVFEVRNELLVKIYFLFKKLNR